jgi:uncharacterized protein YutD
MPANKEDSMVLPNREEELLVHIEQLKKQIERLCDWGCASIVKNSTEACNCTNFEKIGEEND